jgi:hypothetical protein
MSAVAGATGAVLVRHAWEKKLGPSYGVPHPLLADTLDARLIASSLALLPTHKTVLQPPDVHMDAVLGGRTKDGWRYWSKDDGSPSGTLVSYLIGKAGWPVDMVNRARDDAWAPGDGYVPHGAIAKLRDGAKTHGWLVTPAFGKGVPPVTAGIAGGVEGVGGVVLGSAFMLEPGDLFALEPWTLKESVPQGVGIVLEVGTGNGTRNVVTVEGCLTEKGGEPCARWKTRVFHDDGRFAQPGGDDKLLWVVRPS